MTEMLLTEPLNIKGKHTASNKLFKKNNTYLVEHFDEKFMIIGSEIRVALRKYT